MKDLFENISALPAYVSDILATFEDGESDYETCKVLVTQLEAVGYTCDCGLDGVPFNLRRLWFLTAGF